MTPNAGSADPNQQAQDESAPCQLDVKRAREAAKQLLTEQRGNLGMWAAYAGLESKAGQYKVDLLLRQMSSSITKSQTSIGVGPESIDLSVFVMSLDSRTICPITDLRRR